MKTENFSNSKVLTKNMNENILNNRNDFIVRKAYGNFVVVSIFSTLVVVIGMLIDNIIVGQVYGSTALAALGLAGPVGIIFQALGCIGAGGGTVLISHALGAGDKEEVSKYFTLSLFFAIIVGAVITIIGVAFSDSIAVALGAREELVSLTSDYLKGFFLGAIPSALMSFMLGVVKLDGSANLPMLSVLGLTFADIAGDLLVAYVIKGGLFGMALATSISYLIAVLLSCVHFFRPYCTLKLKKPDNIFSRTGKIIVTALPLLITYIATALCVQIINNILAATAEGTAAIAAFSARTQAKNIAGGIITGGAQAVIPIAGLFFGEKDKKSVEDTLKNALKVCLILGIVIGAVLFIFPEIFPSILGIKDEAIMSIAVVCIRFFAVSLPFCAINLVLINYYQCTRNTFLSICTCILQTFLFPVVLALILNGSLGTTGVWIAYLAAEVLTVLFNLIRTLAVRKKHSFFNALSNIPDFTGEGIERLYLSAGNVDDVMNASSALMKFGVEKGLNKKQSYRLALCYEEIAVNVVKHSFRGEKQNWLDAMISISNNQTILSIRDNGKDFDPVNYLNNLDSEDPTAGLGIKTVSGVSDSFTHQRGVGLNTTVIMINR